MPKSDTQLEPDSALFRTLLESTKAIPWKIDWASQSFVYIGPQIETLLGWTPESWKTVQDWVERMHPDDREATVNLCVSQSLAGIDHEADYRALTADGRHVWIRDVVHVIRKGGTVESLIGFMFDISERKKTEQEVLRLQKELEELSYKDSLTGIANRRMFDSILNIEWANARRHRQPLSLILIDIDFFKQYNDRWGHLQGDSCLKRVAGALATAVSRPRDFLARLGGEEFILVLPETDASAAEKIAGRCRDLILELQIPHGKSEIGPNLTISLGAGTILPGHDGDIPDFINEVDRLLYRAKKNGRNCVEYGRFG